jgi:hypothetical protein
VTWRQLNPSEGVYNWSAIDSLLTGQPFILRVYNTDVIHCPTCSRPSIPA